MYREPQRPLQLAGHIGTGRSDIVRWFEASRNEESAEQFLEPFERTVGYAVLLNPGIIGPLIKASGREETVLKLEDQFHVAAEDPLRDDLQQEFLPPVA